jgi:hypothetical protein
VDPCIFFVPLRLYLLLSYKQFLQPGFTLRHLQLDLLHPFIGLDPLVVQLSHFAFAFFNLLQLVLLLVIDDCVCPFQGLEISLQLLVSFFSLLLLTVDIIDLSDQHTVLSKQHPFRFFFFPEKLPLLAKLECALVVHLD